MWLVFRRLRLCSVDFLDSGFGYGSHTQVTAVLGMGIVEVLESSQKFQVLWYGRT